MHADHSDEMKLKTLMRTWTKTSRVAHNQKWGAHWDLLNIWAEKDCSKASSGHLKKKTAARKRFDPLLVAGNPILANLKPNGLEDLTQGTCQVQGQIRSQHSLKKSLPQQVCGAIMDFALV